MTGTSARYSYFLDVLRKIPFIKPMARTLATTVGGSLRDMQDLPGHACLQATQRYLRALVRCEAQTGRAGSGARLRDL